MSCDTSKATPIAQKLIDMLKNLPADADDKFSSIFGSLVFGKLDSNITATIDYPPEPSSTATDQQKSTYTYLKNIADALTLFQNCPIIKLIKNALPTTGTTGTGTTGTSLTPDDIKCALDTVSDVIQSNMSDMVNTYKSEDDTLDDIQTKVQLALNIKKLYLLSLYSNRNQDTVNGSTYKDDYNFFDDFYKDSNTENLYKMKQNNPTDFNSKYKFTLFGYPNSAGGLKTPKALFEDVYDFRYGFYPLIAGVDQTTFFANIPDIYNKFMYVLKTKLPLNPPSASPGTGTGSGTGSGTGTGTGLLWFFLVLVVVVAGVLFYFLNRLNINLYKIGIVIAVFLLVSLFFVYKIHTSPDNNPSQQPLQQPPAKDISAPVASQPNEVFLVSTDSNFTYNIDTSDKAEQVCIALGATVATIQQLEQAYNKGADWCSNGWTKTGDNSYGGYYPINTSAVTGCGAGAIGIMEDSNNPRNANCYGVKPAKPDKFNDPIPGKDPNDTNKYYILPFNGQYWSSAEQTQPNEVFYVAGKTNSNITSDEAQQICKDLNSVVAPKAQLQQAWLNGADWCSPGWTSEVVNGKFVYKGYYPNNTSFVNGCGRKDNNGNWIPQIVQFDKTTNGPDPSGVNCYGVKPSPNYSSPTYSIANFNCMSYHSPNWKCEENPEKLGDYAPIRINNDGDKQCITVNANDTTNCNWMGPDPAGSGNGKARCEADMRAALTETIQNGSNIKTWGWTCLEAPTPPWQPNTWAPFRLDKYGNPQLLTNDLAGKNGLFSKSEVQCKASIQNALAGTNGTITCGTDHKTKFPNEDQSAPEHWCVWSKTLL